jgi:hypothetical protein
MSRCSLFWRNGIQKNGEGNVNITFRNELFMPRSVAKALEKKSRRFLSQEDCTIFQGPDLLIVGGVDLVKDFKSSCFKEEKSC